MGWLEVDELRGIAVPCFSPSLSRLIDSSTTFLSAPVSGLRSPKESNIADEREAWCQILYITSQILLDRPVSFVPGFDACAYLIRGEYPMDQRVRPRVSWLWEGSTR